MATYYRWKKSTIAYEYNEVTETAHEFLISVPSGTSYSDHGTPSGNDSTGYYTLEEPYANSGGTYLTIPAGYYVAPSNPSREVYRANHQCQMMMKGTTQKIEADSTSGTITKMYYEETPVAGTSKGYVYSTDPSAYPNGGISGDYYYDSRTTITSPTAPSSISYLATITTPSVTVSWTAASSSVPSYSVNLYELSYSTNGGSSWTVIGTTASTSYSFSIPAGTTSIQFRVRARDSNNQWGAYTTGTVSQVVQAPTLTVPEMVMQGQSATVSWSGVEGADSYTLERKSSADADWTQVYSGDSLSFTETVGTWTSLQYRVRAVFGETSSGWATSGEIQIVAASALVISGSDGDLGTITSDVSWSVSSDQTAPVIDVTVTVNGGEYAAFQAVSGQNYRIGVLDLPTGTGSIVITASMEVSEAPVTVTRTWTYTKAAQSFPNAGSVARLTQEGDTIWPQTLAEAVRTTGGPWGGDLSKALNLLQGATVYHRTAVPKYSEVSIDLSTAAVGQEVNLPVNGVMTPHIVVHIGNPDPELYDASCDGVWLLRKDIVENGQWNASNVNTLSGSVIMTTMQGYVDDYDETVQAAIKTVKIPYCVGNGSSTVNSGADGLECKMFPLGVYEVGWTTDVNPRFPVDGARLAYFLDGTGAAALQQRIAALNSSPSHWFTRSPLTNNAQIVCNIYPNGSHGGNSAIESYGIRPCFIFPNTFSATYYVDIRGNVHPSQEYTAAGGFSDLWGNDIPTVKIETGSYTGTGTYGASNPNTLTFSFEPKIVFINAIPASYNGLILPFISPCRSALTISTKLGDGARIDVAWHGQNSIPENSVSWHGISSDLQMNQTGLDYQYVALG